MIKKFIAKFNNSKLKYIFKLKNVETKPKLIQCDLIGAILLGIIAAGATVVAMDVHNRILQYQALKAAKVTAAKLAAELAAATKAAAIAADPFTTANLIAVACPNSEVAKLVLALEPTTLQLICNNLIEIHEQIGWFKHIGMLYEPAPFLHSADPWSILKYWHELRVWIFVHRYNEFLFYMTYCKPEMVTYGILDNAKVLLNQQAQFTDKVIFCKMKDMLSIPLDPSHMAGWNLDFHPDCLKKGYVDRWTAHNTFQCGKRGSPVILKNTSMKLCFTNGVIFDPINYEILTKPTNNAYLMQQRMDRRYEALDLSVHSVPDEVRVIDLARSKDRWLYGQYGERSRPPGQKFPLGAKAD